MRKLGATIIIIMLSLARLVATSEISAHFTLKYLASSSGFGIVSIGLTDTDLSDSSDLTLSTFNSTVENSSSIYTIDENTSSDTIQGYLSYFSTSRGSGKLVLSASSLSSQTNTNNTHTLDYTLIVGGQSYNTAEDSPTPISLDVSESSPETPSIKSYPLSIDSEESSFTDAPMDEYSGSIIIQYGLN